MRVLLDINVVLDSLWQRQPWHKGSRLPPASCSAGAFRVSSDYVSVGYYFLHRSKGHRHKRGRAAVRRYVAAFDIIAIGRQTLIDADALPGADFEDNILIAAAVASSLNAIITRNVADFAHAPIPVWEPAELLRRIRSPGPASPTP